MEISYSSPEVKQSEAIPASENRIGWQRHSLSLLFIALVFACLFWRVLLLGETLIDVDTLNNQLPWGYSEGPTDYPYNRRDITDTYVTRDYFVVAAYRDGEEPLWNPYTMAGHPIYADGVTKRLSPFLLLYKWFDVPFGYSLARIAELFLAAVFMYTFLIGIGAGWNGSLFGAIVFSLSSHSLLHLLWMGWWGGLMWLPLLMLFAHRAVKRASYAQAMIAGIFFALQFYTGYLSNQVYYALAFLLFYFLSRSENAVGRRGWFNSLGYSAVTLFTGLTLSASQWMPVLELLRHSNRRIVPTEIGFIYLPPWYLLTLVFPNLFGSAYDVESIRLYTPLGVSHDHILYLGIGALVPAGFGVWCLWKSARHKTPDGSVEGSSDHFTEDSQTTLSSQNSRRAQVENRSRRTFLFYGTLSTLALILMIAAPVYVHVTKYVPVLQSIREVSRAGVLFVFAASTLAAIGMNLLLTSNPERMQRFGRVFLKTAILVTGVVLISGAAALFAVRMGWAADDQGRGLRAFASRAIFNFSGQFWPVDVWILLPIVFSGIVISILWLAARLRLSRELLFAALLVLVVVELALNGRQFNSTHDRSRVFPPTETTRLLQGLPPGRVLVTPGDLESNRRVNSGEKKIIAPPNTLLAYSIPTLTGKDQLFPRSYRELCSIVEPQENLSHIVFDRDSHPVFDLLSARYILTHESAAAPANSKLLRTTEGLSIYENLKALPRAFIAKESIQATTLAELKSIVEDQQIDLREKVILEVPGDLESVEWSKSIDSDQVEIVHDRRNEVRIQVRTDTGGFLVLSDNYYPGWTATIDGAPAEILKANHTMRAVKVSAGEHMVSFAFSPAILQQAEYLSAGSAALILTLFCFAALRRLRPVRPGESTSTTT